MNSTEPYEVLGNRIPGRWIEDFKSPDGWRFIASSSGWLKIRKILCFDIANEKCESGELLGDDCRRAWTGMHDGHAHHGHKLGRGLGGSVRDDRVTIAGKRNIWWLCPFHHELAERPPKAVPPKPKEVHHEDRP